MALPHEAQLEEAAHEADVEQRREVYNLRADAIAESEHGWSGLIFTVADSLATGSVYGIGVMIWAMIFGLSYVGAQVGFGALLFISGVPFFALTILLTVIAVPLHNADSDTHRHYANVAIVVWIVTMVTFLFGALAAVAM